MMPVNTFMEKSDPENTSDHIEYSFAELNLSYYNVIMIHSAQVKHPFKCI